MASSDTESLQANSIEYLKEDNEKKNDVTNNKVDVISDEDGIKEEDVEKGGKKGKKKNMRMMMSATICELETALKESQDLLATRDKEIVKLKAEVDRYKQQTAKEVANKTRLAQSLDESTRQAIELENALQQWQLSMREYQQQVQQLEAALSQERTHSVELERRFSDLYSKKTKEVEQLTSQLIEARKKMPKEKGSSQREVFTGIEESQAHFLKQAVYHLLTDFHAEEHLRAIVSILNFSVEERKTVYAKVQEKKGRSGYGKNSPIVLS